MNPASPSANSRSPFNAAWDSMVRFLLRFERFAWDIGAVLALAIALMTLLALMAPNLADGNLLKRWRELLIAGFGGGSLLVVVTATMIGIHLLRRQAQISQPRLDTASGTAAPADASSANSSQSAGLLPVRWDRVIMLEIGAFACLALMSVTGDSSPAAIGSMYNGGIIGWGLAELLRVLLIPIGLDFVLLQSFIWGAVCLFCWVYGLGLSRSLVDVLRRWTEPASIPVAMDNHPAVAVSNAEGQEVVSNQAPARKRMPALPVEFRKRFRLNPEQEKSTPPPPRDDRLPPLGLLIHEQGFKPDERNINMTAGLIEKTLSEFGIPARVIGFRVGPTVTQFAVEPGFLEKNSASEEDTVRQKVRVSQISSLQRDLALALSAERLRIEAPVPGRPYVGIEVPNMRTSVVRLRPILENEAFYKVGSPLSIALGRDVSGQPVVADLMKMPHLLIAGTTGSGKSVCIAALTACLVMNNTPQELRLVMIDPKMVELVRFNGLPHLFGKVETDLERILGVLRWTVVEMDRRYKMLEEMHARHIDSYNRKVSRRKGYEPMPRIVVMIDELADLMMSAPDQTEHTLIRLAQMARATGIHLVVATQRPSTDVVTGLIKANFPARIAFAVASSIDSRVILDSAGAESLLGQGDMLFLPPEASAPQRTQGVMITDQEIERVITFWQKNHPIDEAAPPPWEAMLAEEEFTADKDNLVLKAVQIVQETQRASASMLQRRLRIGYPRAARLVDELEQLGVVGPSQGGGREREVLIGPDDELPSHPADE